LVEDSVHCHPIAALSNSHTRSSPQLLLLHCPNVEQLLSDFFSFQIINLNWQDYVSIDPTLYRPAEVEYLNGDSSKIRNLLGWKPEYSFDDLVAEMVHHDIKCANV
jgi:GDP-D-mannose dehydratase